MLGMKMTEEAKDTLNLDSIQINDLPKDYIGMYSFIGINFLQFFISWWLMLDI
jgi:hypothetical protein